jgi:hypothetical protein
MSHSYFAVQLIKGRCDMKILDNHHEKLIRIKQVIELTGLSRSYIYPRSLR